LPTALAAVGDARKGCPLMNTILLWAVPAALLLALAGWTLLRRRPRQGRRTASPPPAQLDTPRTPLPTPEAGDVAAQHLAAIEALRQARRRKAEDQARLAADPATDRAADPVVSRAPSRPAAVSTAPPAAQAAAARTAAAHPPAVRPGLPPAPARPLAPVPSRPEPVVPVLSPLAIQLNTGRAPAHTPPAAPAGLAPLRTPPRPTRPPTVLVADDSKVVRVKTGRLFEKLGWRVLLADDGQAALRCMTDESPDLLITDVEMPGLDGFALTRHLRGHPRWARLPVIMITSSDDKHRAEAIAAGVNVLLGKPYVEEVLVAQAQALLGSPAAIVPALH
jgi:CheY-like chemotaxis protein